MEIFYSWLTTCMSLCFSEHLFWVFCFWPLLHIGCVRFIYCNGFDFHSMYVAVRLYIALPWWVRMNVQMWWSHCILKRRLNNVDTKTCECYDYNMYSCTFILLSLYFQTNWLILSYCCCFLCHNLSLWHHECCFV